MFSFHKDWAGFSGGWYPTNDNPLQLTLLHTRRGGTFLDACFPLLGDVRLGYVTKYGAANPHNKDKRRFVLDRYKYPKGE